MKIDPLTCTRVFRDWIPPRGRPFVVRPGIRNNKNHHDKGVISMKFHSKFSVAVRSCARLTVAAAQAPEAQAQEMKFFRIGTGGAGGRVHVQENSRRCRS